MNKPVKRTKEKKVIRKDSFTVVTILAYICSLVYRIFLYHLIGEKGVGYFGIANEIYVIVTFLLSYSLTEAVASLIRYRIKRGQYKNAERVMQSAVILAIAVGVLICGLLLVGGQFIASKVIGIPLAGLSISLMSLSVIFVLLMGVFRGYFQGNGSYVPSMHSKLIEILFVITGGMIGAWLLYGYGQKVSALLQNEDYAAAYGAMGASVGFLVASILCFLYMLFLKLVFRRKIHRQILQDMQRNQDSRIRIFQMLAGIGVPYAIYGFLFHCLPLLDGCLYFHFMEVKEENIVLWGNFYGKYMVLFGIVSSVILLISVEPIRKIIAMTEREEYRTAREKIGYLMHQTALIVVPAAIFTAVFAENILNILFKGSNLKTAEWVAWGSIGIVCYVFAMIFMNILMRLKKMNYVLGCGAIALVFHTIVTIVLLQKTQLNMLALVIGSIIFYIVVMVTGFVLVSKCFQYSQEWIRTIAFTIVNAGIAGLIVMMINKALIGGTGSTVSLIICLPIGILIYMILLILTRSVSPQEIENISGGGILYKIAKLLHFM